ncbi:MAG: hypothetical protein ACFFBV_04325 [Promethearchaeota archaeon]
MTYGSTLDRPTTELKLTRPCLALALSEKGNDLMYRRDLLKDYSQRWRFSQVGLKIVIIERRSELSENHTRDRNRIHFKIHTSTLLSFLLLHLFFPFLSLTTRDFYDRS